jgi:hypothetical protein
MLIICKIIAHMALLHAVWWSQFVRLVTLRETKSSVKTIRRMPSCTGCSLHGEARRTAAMFEIAGT